MISVIIPAYNAQRYLRQALDSVLSQCGVEIEVVVVDDGSTDATSDIAAEYVSRDLRVKLLRGENRGLGAARNRGVDASAGEWVTFLDSDDALFPDALASLLSATGSTGCDIASGRIVRGREMDACCRQKGGAEAVDAGEAVAMTLYQNKRMEPSACGKLYRRSIFETERFAEGLWYEDLDFFYRAYFAAGRIAVADVPVYFYRCNPEGFLSSFTPGRLDVLKVTERLENYISRSHPGLLPAARDRRLSANFNMLGLLWNQPLTEEYAAKIKECLTLIRAYRLSSLLNPEVRLKNKLGIMASYAGVPMLRCLLKYAYRARPHVVTFDGKCLADACRRLGGMVAGSGYEPDIIVGIRSGGEYVAAELITMFPKSRLGFIDLKRPGTRRKSRIKKILRFLPSGVLDRLRILESRLVALKAPKVNDAVVVPQGLSGLGPVEILVADDAVDSGATLASVIKGLANANPGAKIRSAVITVTTVSPMVTPDYALYNNRTLIRFPWSMDWK